MAVFLCASIGMRLYITWVTSTGYTYGALGTPIAFLLFAFFLGMAVISGAQFNNAIQEMWPARMTRRERRRWRRLEMTRATQRLRTEEATRPGARTAKYPSRTRSPRKPRTYRCRRRTPGRTRVPPPSFLGRPRRSRPQPRATTATAAEHGSCVPARQAPPPTTGKADRGTVQPGVRRIRATELRPRSWPVVGAAAQEKRTLPETAPRDLVRRPLRPVRCRTHSSSPPPGGSPSKTFLQSGHTGEPGLADLVTGKTSPHSATTYEPVTALSAILSFCT